MSLTGNLLRRRIRSRIFSPSRGRPRWFLHGDQSALAVLPQRSRRALIEREDVADAWSARRHPFGLLLSKFEKIEIVAAILLFLSASESFFGNGEQRKTWRKRESFLRAGQHDVDPERVHVDLHRGK